MGKHFFNLNSGGMMRTLDTKNLDILESHDNQYKGVPRDAQHGSARSFFVTIMTNTITPFFVIYKMLK